MDDDVAEEIAVAAGYGIAALALQIAIAKQFAKRVGLTHSEAARAFDAAKAVIENGYIESDSRARQFAQAALTGAKSAWNLPLPKAE